METKLGAGSWTEMDGDGAAARRPNYTNAIKVIKAIIRRVKRLSENTSSGCACEYAGDVDVAVAEDGFGLAGF